MDKNDTELLKLLISEGYNERKTIGEELHGSKFYLNELTRNISDLEKNAESGKIDLNILDKQKQLISEYLIALKQIRAKLYPPFLPLSGALVSIKQYIIDYPKTLPVNLDFDFDPEERNNLGEVKDITIYKSCIEIIDLMFLRKAKTIQVKLKCDGKIFEFEIAGKLKKFSIDKFDLNEKIDLIKAFIICAEGEVQEETNWKDKFKLTFKIQK